MKTVYCPYCKKSGGVIFLNQRIWDQLYGCLNCMKMFLIGNYPPECPKVFYKKEAVEDEVKGSIG